MTADFVNLDENVNPNCTCLRHFDLYKLHSSAGGLIQFTDGVDVWRYRDFCHWFDSCINGRLRHGGLQEKVTACMKRIFARTRRMWACCGQTKRTVDYGLVWLIGEIAGLGFRSFR
uniref:Uncharacterized protein n=1 Tax=Opuntia streptacantha TaxID=393608 RepID=A0A7C9A9W5_OPUST